MKHIPGIWDAINDASHDPDEGVPTHMLPGNFFRGLGVCIILLFVICAIILVFAQVGIHTGVIKR